MQSLTPVMLYSCWLPLLKVERTELSTTIRLTKTKKVLLQVPARLRNCFLVTFENCKCFTLTSEKKNLFFRMTPKSLENFYIDLMAFRQGMLATGAADELNATATVEAIFWQFSPVLRK